MGVDRDSGGFQWALPVMVIERIEQRKVEYRRQRGILIEAYRRPCRRIFVGLRPAVRARQKPYAVGPQRVEFVDPHLALLAKADGLDISVAGQQEMRGNRFEERCAILTRVRSPHEIEQRMVVALVRTLRRGQKTARRCFRRSASPRDKRWRCAHSLHAQARHSRAASPTLHRDQSRRARGFGLGE